MGYYKETVYSQVFFYIFILSVDKSMHEIQHLEKQEKQKQASKHWFN